MSATKTETLEESVERMKKIHPVIWVDYRCGIDLRKAGVSRPYRDYWANMSGSARMLMLGWDCANSKLH